MEVAQDNRLPHWLWPSVKANLTKCAAELHHLHGIKNYGVDLTPNGTFCGVPLLAAWLVVSEGWVMRSSVRDQEVEEDMKVFVKDLVEKMDEDGSTVWRVSRIRAQCLTWSPS